MEILDATCRMQPFRQSLRPRRLERSRAFVPQACTGLSLLDSLCNIDKEVKISTDGKAKAESGIAE